MREGNIYLAGLSLGGFGISGAQLDPKIFRGAISKQLH
jgi:hypothetical protein